MAALNAPAFTSVNIPVGSLAKGATISQRATVAIPASGAGTALNDTIGFLILPRGATLIDMDFEVEQLETGGPTLTLDLGYAGATQQFAAAYAGANAATSAAVGANKFKPLPSTFVQFTADTPIFATIHAAATTKKAGNMSVLVQYTMDGLAS